MLSYVDKTLHPIMARIAYQSGIDPVHFWMVVLLAFELGYLTPPIALNQILTRQVVGDEEMDQTQAESQAGNTWWQRHERLVMPVTVMAIALFRQSGEAGVLSHH